MHDVGSVIGGIQGASRLPAGRARADCVGRQHGTAAKKFRISRVGALNNGTSTSELTRQHDLKHLCCLPDFATTADRWAEEQLERRAAAAAPTRSALHSS